MVFVSFSRTVIRESRPGNLIIFKAIVAGKNKKMIKNNLCLRLFFMQLERFDQKARMPGKPSPTETRFSP